MPLSTLLRDESHSKYFETQSGRVLRKKLLGNHESHPVFYFIKEVTEIFIVTTELSGKGMHPQVASHICTAMLALKPRMLRESILNAKALLVNKRKTLPLRGAIADSVGDEKTHAEAIQDLERLFDSGSNFFPGALDASVATGQIMILGKQLEFIREKIEDMPKVRDKKSMRKTAKYIGKALMVAIRLHKNDAGKLLFEFFHANKDLRGSRYCLLGTWLFQDAVRTTNTELIYSALELDHPLNPAKKDRYKLDDDQVEFLVRSNNTTILDMLLRDGHILPNEECEGYTLLEYALEKRRRSVALVLLQHNADIDGPSSKVRVTALRYAVRQGYLRDVLFRSKMAKLDYPTTPEKSPLKMVKELAYQYNITK